MPQTFSAIILIKQGINPYVPVPLRVSRAFGVRGYVPVKGRLQGHPIIATLVPVGGGRHHLFLHGVMRKAAGVGVGDRAHLSLTKDAAPRMPDVPAPFAAALKRDKAARMEWESFTPSKRKMWLTYLGHLKSPEALERNVKRCLKKLHGNQEAFF
jgi:hypothetical protein